MLAVEVLSFTDQYQLAAPLYGLTSAGLAERDAGRPQPVRRWVVLRDGRPWGAVTAGVRPDRRTFLSFAVADASAYGPLVAAVADEVAGRLHTMVDDADPAARGALEAAGFSVEMTLDRFRVPFSDLLGWLRRAPRPSGIAIRPADEVDADRLFSLDNTLRQDVPGSEGWRGDRALFREELSDDDPAFDPAAYLVAVDQRNGEYAGLVRIWRNPEGPRIGLVGVLRQYRTTTVAAALLRPALVAAAQWGHDDLIVETSTANRILHPRLTRLGAERTGRLHQLVRRSGGGLDEPARRPGGGLDEPARRPGGGLDEPARRPGGRPLPSQPVSAPVVIVGMGQMGQVFARGFLAAGHAVHPVLRDTDAHGVAAEVGTPALALVAVGEADLHPVLGDLPAPWRERPGLLQNELLPRDWEAHGLEEPTVAVVWFEKKADRPVKVIIPTPIYGPAAHLVAGALGAIDIPASVVPDPEALIFELVAKNLYILVANIAGLETGGTVGELWAEHRALAEEVAAEVLAIQAALTGRDLPASRLVAAMEQAFAADPEHGTKGRSAPARLARARRHAADHGIATPRLDAIARTAGAGAS